METLELPPPVQMLHLIAGFWSSQIIYVIARLGIADVFREGPQTAETVALQTNTHGPSIYRLLRAATSIGLFVGNQNKTFTITGLGKTLMTDSPGSHRDFAIAELGQEHYQGWGNLAYSIQTGTVAFQALSGQNVWDYYKDHPNDGQRFIMAMSNLSNSFNPAITHSYDFSQFDTVVDVGGAGGTLLCGILRDNPATKGVVFDLPHVVDHATTYIQEQGLSDRCRILPGDFFDRIPTDGDAYLLKFIIHDWNDEQAVNILKNCYQAMPDHARLLLIESVIPNSNEPNFGKLLDINMLVMTGGMERDADQYGQLLTKAGFHIRQIIPTPSPLQIIECSKN
ncbi:methyltransferase [Spirosoma sp. SC4-14]|uniref:methyltransferase n=1 Tax=Spirosoma sp. SC4-14 TaxID=3128900 RepID=UPI0030D2966E